MQTDYSRLRLNERVNERGDKYQQSVPRPSSVFFSEIHVSSPILVYAHVTQYSQISPAAVDNI